MVYRIFYLVTFKMRYGDIKEVNGKWRETNHAYFSFAYNAYPYAVIMPEVTPGENKEVWETNHNVHAKSME